MKKITRTNQTSKLLGTLGADSAGDAAHGAALVHQVLRGFSYEPERYDRDMRQARQQSIVDAIARVQAATTILAATLETYVELYGEMPQPVVDRVYALGTALTDAAQAIDPEWVAIAEEMSRAHAWDMRCHYGKEPSDYR